MLRNLKIGISINQLCTRHIELQCATFIELKFLKVFQYTCIYGCSSNFDDITCIIICIFSSVIMIVQIYLGQSFLFASELYLHVPKYLWIIAYICALPRLLHLHMAYIITTTSYVYSQTKAVGVFTKEEKKTFIVICMKC